MIQHWIFILLLFMGLSHNLSKASQCVTRGRFPDDQGDCRGYTTCLMGGSGTFTQYNLTCPPNFIYHHLDRQCTNATDYQCLPSYKCRGPGNYMNLEGNCTSYIVCVASLSNIVTARLVYCPTNTVFDVVEEKCVTMTEYGCGNDVQYPKIQQITEKDLDTVQYQYSSSSINLQWSCRFITILQLFNLFYRYLIK